MTGSYHGSRPPCKRAFCRQISSRKAAVCSRSQTGLRNLPATDYRRRPRLDTKIQHARLIVVFNSGRAASIAGDFEELKRLAAVIADGNVVSAPVSARGDDGTFPLYDVMIRGSEVTHLLLSKFPEGTEAKISDFFPIGFYDNVPVPSVEAETK